MGEWEHFNYYISPNKLVKYARKLAAEHADCVVVLGKNDLNNYLTQSAVTITKDDITAVIVAKIKKKRDNNEKIGRLLKTYGVAQLSDLPAEKYEAFLADELSDPQLHHDQRYRSRSVPGQRLDPDRL